MTPPRSGLFSPEKNPDFFRVAVFRFATFDDLDFVRTVDDFFDLLLDSPRLCFFRNAFSRFFVAALAAMKVCINAALYKLIMGCMGGSNSVYIFNILYMK